MAEQTIFDKIISGEISSYIVWQDEDYAAFLTPFANTRGVTIVVPKNNPGDYVFDLDDQQIAGLMSAAKKVAKLLEAALQVERVALVFEGEAVPHVHAKLYPMFNAGSPRIHLPRYQAFFPTYQGFISTIEGPKMDDEELKRIQYKIMHASGQTEQTTQEEEHHES